WRVFLAYASSKGYPPLDRRFYLPEDWAADPARRAKAHVPAAIRFQETWRIARDLLGRSQSDLPPGWVTGADGRRREDRPGPDQAGWRRGAGGATDRPADRGRVEDRLRRDQCRPGGLV